MNPNAMKQKILRDEVVVGMGLDTPDPMMVEYAAMAGLDFVRLDCQQGPFTLEGIEHAIRAAEAAGITPTVRLPGPQPEFVLQILNRGAAGVTFPGVQTAEDALAAVRSVKFAPEGERALSVAGGRGMHARWSLGMDPADAYAAANRETLVVCLVEDPVGLQNVEEIAAVPGVDVITFGAGDLSATTGHTGDVQHPEVRGMIRDGIRRVRAAGKPAGMSIGSRAPEVVREYVELGVRVLQFLPAPLITTAVSLARADSGI